MTTQKTLKRRIRARSEKTGESYTSARAQILHKADPQAPDAMELTRMTDDAMVRGSGKSIGEWLGILDSWGATERKHAEIARWLVAEHGIGGWWAQNVTVGYERARGLRALHDRPSGYEVSASRTINAAPERVSDAFADAALRERWLPDAPISPRTANRGRSARFDWSDPPSLVGFTLFPKGDGKTLIGLVHQKLPDAASAERHKGMWRERLSVLKEMLEAD